MNEIWVDMEPYVFPLFSCLPVELMFYVLSLSYFSVCCIDAVFIRVELDHLDVMGRVLATKS